MRCGNFVVFSEETYRNIGATADGNMIPHDRFRMIIGADSEVVELNDHSEDDDAPLSRQEREWVLLYDRLSEYLKPLGTESPIGAGDYWPGRELGAISAQDRDSKSGFVGSVHRERPAIAAVRPRRLGDRRGGRRSGDGETMARMGLVISKDGVVDELRREFLPKRIGEFRY